MRKIKTNEIIIFYLHSEKLIKLNKINIKSAQCLPFARRHQLFTFYSVRERNYNWKSFSIAFESGAREASRQGGEGLRRRKGGDKKERSEKVRASFRKRFVINYNFNYCLYRREVSLKNTSPLFFLRLSSPAPAENTFHPRISF